MFTGIVEATGEITRILPGSSDRTIVVHPGELPLDDVQVGDSICVSGVCLTVTRLEGKHLCFDVSIETMDCSTFRNCQSGTRVNLEKSLLLTDRLGGHLVSGHVDCVGSLLSIQDAGKSKSYVFDIPGEYSRYICCKGSVCIDGVSLTVNDVEKNTFSVNIIPHTMQETVFPDYVEGSRVNVEVDLVARYIESLTAGS